MNNLEKYKTVFCESFSISETDLEVDLEYNSIEAWDSVGHMGMIADLEDKFDIMLDTDDIIDFSSYNTGIKILKKYDIEVI
jgi:acyl carrier protein